MFNNLYNKIILPVFKGLPNFIKLGNWLDDVFSGVNQLFLNIDAYRDIDTSQGALLDKIGTEYNVLRGQADDNFYRLMIKSKIETNHGDCTVNGILETIKRSLDIDITGIKILPVAGEPNAIEISNISLEWAKNNFQQQYIFNRILEVVAAGIRVASVTFIDKSNVQLTVTGIASPTITASVKGDTNV